jgi:hypothetical protein
MPREKKLNPGAFIGIGVCFMGAGIALSASLRESGAAGSGVGLLGLGVIFLILGLAQKRKLDSGESASDEDDRPPA